MRRFRILLTLLLCLTVPAAGWASLLDGPLCPRLHGSPHASAVADYHHDDVVTAATGQHHRHCGADHDQGAPCKGDHCDCGCGLGLCSSASLSLLPPLSISVVFTANKQAIAPGELLPYAAALSTSPLRPPIS